MLCKAQCDSSCLKKKGGGDKTDFLDFILTFVLGTLLLLDHLAREIGFMWLSILRAIFVPSKCDECSLIMLCGETKCYLFAKYQYVYM